MNAIDVAVETVGGQGDTLMQAQRMLRPKGRRQRLAQQTGGAFDITTGVLTRLWRAAIRDGKVPEEAERRAAIAASGAGRLRCSSRVPCSIFCSSPVCNVFFRYEFDKIFCDSKRSWSIKFGSNCKNFN